MCEAANTGHCHCFDENSPKISIIIPMYNAENYIEETLASCAAQDYPNMELIVVDDCSTDQSLEKARGYLNNSSLRWRIIRNENNSGVSVARNRGIQAAEGEYVLFCDADDLMHPMTLSVLTEVMQKYRADAVFVDRKLFDCENPLSPQKRIELNAYLVGEEQSTITGGLIYKALISSRNLYFEPGMNRGEDTVFVLDVLSQSERIYRIDAPLYYYRRNINTSLSFGQWNNTKAEIAREYSILKCLQNRMNKADEAHACGVLIRAMRKKKNAIKRIIEISECELNSEQERALYLHPTIKMIIRAKLSLIWKLCELLYLLPYMESQFVFSKAYRIKQWIDCKKKGY